MLQDRANIIPDSCKAAPVGNPDGVNFVIRLVGRQTRRQYLGITMFHMLSCFNLKPDETIEEFQSDYFTFVEEMKHMDLVESTGSVGRRQSDTPMDTDDERDHEYFVVMSFRDRDQVDAAYAHIMRHIGPGEASHTSVYGRVSNPVFICWEDLPS